MSWKAQIDDKGVVTRYKDSDTNEVVSAKEFERRMQMQSSMGSTQAPGISAGPMGGGYQMPVMPGGAMAYPQDQMPVQSGQQAMPTNPLMAQPGIQGMQGMQSGQGTLAPQAMQPAQSMQPIQPVQPASNPLIQPGAKMLQAGGGADMLSQPASPLNNPTVGSLPTAGMPVQGKNLRLEGLPHSEGANSSAYKNHGFIDATSIAILLPTLVLLALILAAAHKKRLFPWQTIRTFNPPSGLMNPRDYERSYLCPPNLRRHGRLGKRNPNATWSEADGTVLPFGFLARTHLPVTIPMGRLPNKNMFIVAPSGSGKTTLMRAVIKALLAKPCVVIALEAKANDPHLDEKKEGFKFSLLPEAEHAGFDTLYFNPLDSESIHWNPLDLPAVDFAGSIVQDINSLAPEEQHWAERDHGYIYGLTQLLKWGAVQVVADDENGQASEVQPLPCNPRGLMRLVNNRRNIVESLRRMKSNPKVDVAELSEMTQTLSSIIRTDTDWDKNIQGVRGRLRMFKNPGVLRVTEQSNVDIKAAMHHPTLLIFGAPASLGADAESLASCFVYQLQQALHTRYGTKSVLPLFAFFDEYQTLNMDIAGRLSAIVRGANGGLTVILQNISQIAGDGGSKMDPAGKGSGGSEIKTIFSNSAIRVCLHNADETTALFFSNEIGKHAVVVPGISDHYMSTGFGIFPTSWNRIHSQQVVARVDPDAIKRMEKHHALVYLAPAGDPEFGEVKPLMVDLRGIEEIARLHLLHNVSARKENAEHGPDGGPDGGGNGGGPHGPGPGGAPSFAMGDLADAAVHAATQVAAHAPGAAANIAASQLASGIAQAAVPTAVALAAVAAGVAANGARICQSCHKAAGKGKFCIECGAFIGPAQAAEADVPTKVELTTSASLLNQPIQAQVAPQAQLATVAAAAVEPAAVIQAPAAQIAPSVPIARKQPLFESPAQIAQSAQQALGVSAYQPKSAAATSVLEGAQRQPVTSFNLDPSRLGYAAQQPQKDKNAKPNGIEF